MLHISMTLLDIECSLDFGGDLSGLRLENTLPNVREKTPLFDNSIF